MNHVKKHPSPDTLAEVRAYTAGEEPLLSDGWEAMSDSELADWIAAEKAKGWQPQRPAPVPESVSPRQMRRALNAAGLRDTVESAVAAAGRDMQDDWEFALEIRRDWPALKSMTVVLGMTEAQVDDLFRAAADIP